MPDLNSKVLVSGQGASATLGELIRGHDGGSEPGKFVDSAGELATPTTIVDSGGPVASAHWFDVDIPATGGLFRFRAIGVDCGNFSVAFSYDGGETFVADSNESDSYTFAYDTLSLVLSTAVLGDLGGDSLLSLTMQSPTPGLLHYVNLTVFPGSAALLTQCPEIFIAQPPANVRRGVGFLNPDADTTPVPARATTMRFQPYGNGDANPPTSNETVSVAQWTLEELMPTLP